MESVQTFITAQAMLTLLDNNKGLPEPMCESTALALFNIDELEKEDIYELVSAMAYELSETPNHYENIRTAILNDTDKTALRNCIAGVLEYIDTSNHRPGCPCKPIATEFICQLASGIRAVLLEYNPNLKPKPAKQVRSGRIQVHVSGQPPKVADSDDAVDKDVKLEILHHIAQTVTNNLRITTDVETIGTNLPNDFTLAEIQAIFIQYGARVTPINSPLDKAVVPEELRQHVTHHNESLYHISLM